MTLLAHLAVLGLDLTATRREVRERYRKLVMLYHPDRNPAGIEQFRAIRQAYEFLLAAGIPDLEADDDESVVEAAASRARESAQAEAAARAEEKARAEAESAPRASLFRPGSERRRGSRRGTPGDRRFEFIMEDEYKGTNVRILV